MKALHRCGLNFIVIKQKRENNWCFVSIYCHVKKSQIVIHFMWCFSAGGQMRLLILTACCACTVHMLCTSCLRPQVIRKPGRVSADKRERIGLTQSNNVIKHNTFAVCICVYKSYQVSLMSGGYLGNHLRPGDSQPITKLIPVGPHCGKVTLPGTYTQRINVSHTYRKPILSNCIQWDH